ncbi:hemolysin III family protein [Verrucomicrobiaceae bacterium N1E253]|uniref:Hemolysin III family protein n=1 Tax=Oceaniferula marina TaxID=2748318 RepID=A0A851GB35_9BACT|nr:hemolysin III family protein [Oceaniferula marina]NWK54823.1 hemolysin III family protein [Oceaniferula marina]
MSKERSHLCDSPAEEIASVVTHTIAALLSIAGLVAMIIASEGEALNIVSASIFGACLILLYSASSLYHAFSSPKVKSFFQVLDHACIYLLIAGSYTPLTLVAMQGAWGWSIFGIVWFCAIAGVLLKTCLKGKKDSKLSTILYLVMGWMIVVAIKPLMASIDPGGLAWIVAGGVTYSLGVIFYAWEKLIFNHAIWHLFVLGGSACHVIAYVFYVL